MKTFTLSQQRTVDLITILDNLPKDAIMDNKTYRLRNNALNDLEEQNKEYVELIAEQNKKVQDWLKKTGDRKRLDEMEILVSEEKDKIMLQTLLGQRQSLINIVNKKIEEKFPTEQKKIDEEGEKEKILKLGNEKFDIAKKLFDEYGFKIFTNRRVWGFIDGALEAVKTVEE